MSLLKKEHGFVPEDIAAIHLIGSEGSRMTVEPKEAKWNPSVVGEACYSAPYAVATAAIKGTLFLEDFNPQELSRTDKVELMKLVTVDIDSTIDTPFDGFTIEVTLKNGNKLTQTSPFVLGHPRNPMSWEDIEEKFWRCVPFAAREISNTKLQHVIEVCKSLEQIDDVTLIVDSLIQ